MKPVAMKRTKKEKKEHEKRMSPEAVGENTVDDYNYGLRFSLGDEEISKLDMASFKVGDEMQIAGTVKVVSYSEDENENNKSKRAELLITTLGLSPENMRLKNRYPNS